jgi:predicted Zn-dependent protease
VTAFGSFATDAEAVAVANSRGIRAAERRTTSQLLTVTMGPDDGTGYAEQCAIDATTIDAAAIGREAAERARASVNPVTVDPGDYPVVLHQYAVVDLLDMLGYLGFSGLAVQEDRSFWEAGKRVASPLVTVVDDGLDPAGLPMGFDAEGVPKQRLALLEAGVCRDIAFDQQTAARVGRPSTGHGLPAPNPYGPFPTNMVMAPGDASFDELVGGLDRGLLVTRFHYTNPVHGKRVIITGMTRDGTFLVEGGKIVGPVRNLRFTMSYLDALANVEAVSRERRCIRGFLGGSVVPALRLSSFSFTGATAAG